jgi:hypothetical protein
MVPELLVLALEYQRLPLSYAHLADPERALPKSFDSLVGGLGAALAPAHIAETAGALGSSPDALTAAALFLVRHVLFVPGATHYRVLGLNPSAEPERIGEHYRVLVGLFHPDRLPPNQRQRGAQETARLNAAYAVLKEPDSRRRYDLEIAVARPRRRGRVKGGAKVAVPSSQPQRPGSWTPTHWLLAGSLGVLFAIGLGAAAVTSRPTLRVTVDPNQVQAPKPAYLEAAPATPDAPGSVAQAIREPSAEGTDDPKQILERLAAYVRDGNLGAALSLLSEDVRISRAGLPETPGAGPLFQGILAGDLRLSGVSLAAAGGGRYLAVGRLVLGPSTAAAKSANANRREGRIHFEITARSDGYRISSLDYEIEAPD